MAAGVEARGLPADTRAVGGGEDRTGDREIEDAEAERREDHGLSGLRCRCLPREYGGDLGGHEAAVPGLLLGAMQRGPLAHHMVGVVDHVVRAQDGVRGQVAQRQVQDHLVRGAVRVGGEVEPVRGVGRGDGDRVGPQRLGQAAGGAAQPRPLGPQLGGEGLGPAGHGVLEDHGPQLGMGQEQEVQDPAVDGAAADQPDGVHRTGPAVQRPAREGRRRGRTGRRDLAALQDGERVAGVEIVEDLHRGGPLEPLLHVGGKDEIHFRPITGSGPPR